MNQTRRFTTATLLLIVNIGCGSPSRDPSPVTNNAEQIKARKEAERDAAIRLAEVHQYYAKELSKRDELPTPRAHYKELANSKSAGRAFMNVLVKSDISRSDIIELATYLHKVNSSSPIHFFDDESEFEAFKLHEMNYPDPKFEFPEKWATKHYVALLINVHDRNGKRWELWSMFGGDRFLTEGSNSSVIAEID